MVRNHLLALCALMASACGACCAQAAPEGHRRIGYVPLRDGTQLAYILYRPDTQGRFPVLVIYNPYWGGGTAFGPDERAYLAHGYAVLGVSARGTGCSSDVFHSMFEEPEAQDGAQVIEWAAAQPWSNGSVGMYGNSYSGVTQMMVGSLRPPHLKALAAGGTAGDLYTDVAYAGGIFNFGFMAQWTYYTQPEVSAIGVQLREAAGDRVCAQHRAAQLPAGDTYIQMRNHPLRDAWWEHLEWENTVDRIQAPVLLAQAWQDQQAGIRGPIRMFERIRAPKRIILSNGTHSFYQTAAMRAERIRWFDHWLKGEQNGIDREPPVSIWFETAEGGGDAKPSWIWKFASFPPPETRWQSLYLTADGKLQAHTPAGPQAGVRSYVYPAGSEVVYSNETFAMPPVPIGSLSYRTAPAAEDTVILGAPLVTLHMSAERPDTDLMVTLHDVSREGQVLYLQRGFLRASHRGVDPARSQPHDPFHPHDRAQELTPGRVYEIQVQIFPVGHVLRKGHSLELSIMAPPTIPLPNWGFMPVSLSGVNTIYQTAQYPSRLDLPVIPGRHAEAPAPACGSLVLQPCRKDIPGIEKEARELDQVFRKVHTK